MLGNFKNKIIQYFKISLTAVIFFDAALMIVSFLRHIGGNFIVIEQSLQSSFSPSIAFHVQSQKRSRRFLIFRRMIWVLEL